MALPVRSPAGSTQHQCDCAHPIPWTPASLALTNIGEIPGEGSIPSIPSIPENKADPGLQVALEAHFHAVAYGETDRPGCLLVCATGAKLEGILLLLIGVSGRHGEAKDPRAPDLARTMCP
jgi:hypothetical protein